MNDAVPASPTRRAAVPPARVERWEWAIAIGIALSLAILLTSIRIVRLNVTHGDAAQFLQITQNISERGAPVSQLGAAILDFFNRGIPTDSVATLAASPLAPTAEPEFNIFHFHAYFILYPIGLLARIIPKEVLLEASFVLSFVGCALLAYASARTRGVSAYSASLLALLIVTHPAWSNGLEWQFYPDRLFVLGGFVLMLAAADRETKFATIFVLALACASINERCAALGGVFLIARAALYWRSTGQRRLLDIALGTGMLVYSLMIVKLVLTNVYYGSFFSMQMPAFVTDEATRRNVVLFLLASAPLLLIALFEVRAAAIALLLMLPNIFGSIAGAEKIAWATHYHDLYLPALTWAALAGLTTFNRRFPGVGRAWIAPTMLTVIFLGAICYEPATGRFSSEAYKASFFVRLISEAQSYLGAPGAQLRADTALIRDRVPPGSMISSVEAGMPLVFEHRTVEYYPIGIDRADFVLAGSGLIDGKPAITGAVSFLGAAEQQRADVMLDARLRRDGFDLDHPAVKTTTGLVLLARRPNTSRSGH